MTMLSARIERLPFSGFHRRLLMMGGLGYTFDAMDASVIAFVLPVLRTDWGLSSVQIGVLASANFIGFFFGALERRARLESDRGWQPRRTVVPGAGGIGARYSVFGRKWRAHHAGCHPGCLPWRQGRVHAGTAGATRPAAGRAVH